MAGQICFAEMFVADGKLREQNLAEELCISRMVVRLALGEVEREGLVVREPNKGFRVRSFTIEEVTDAILVRGELEGMAARTCAEIGLADATISSCRAEYLIREHARKSALNKRLGFDAMRQHQQTPALPGLSLVKNSA